MNGSETVEDALHIISTVKQSAKELVQRANVPKNRDAEDLNLRNYLFFHHSEIIKTRTKRDLTPEERTFIYDAFEYEKLIDRYFQKASLLTKYSDLIVKLNAETQTLPASPAKP